jgi:anti-sigma regulatory factor (Ser/Thr protein kinase)
MAALREEAGRRAERHARRLADLAAASARVAARQVPADVCAQVAREATRLVGARTAVIEPGDDRAGPGSDLVVALGEAPASPRLRASPAGGRPFTPEDVGLLRQLCLIGAAALETAALYEREHDTVESLQRALLPTLPDRPEPFEIAGRYLPATAGDRVGGDWYDAFPLPGGRLGVMVGDVVGHGLGAASEMGILRSVARAYAVEHDDVAGVIDRLSAFVGRFGEGLSATVAYVVLDPDEESLRYALAGHVPPVLVGADGATRLLERPRGTPLGVTTGSLTEGRADFRAGDTLVLFTDGLVERRGESLDVGLAALQDRAAAGGPVDALLDRLTGLLDGHDDDVAVLAVRAVELRDRLDVDLPAEAGSLQPARAALRAWLAGLEAPPFMQTDLLLAAGEALANSVEHGGASGGRLRLRGHRTAHRLVVCIGDDGAWTEPVIRQGRGRGLRIMRTLMDEVTIDAGPAGTRVDLALNFPVEA